jgi:hypothetical protein
MHMPLDTSFEEIPAQMVQAKVNLPVSIKYLRNAPTEIVLNGNHYLYQLIRAKHYSICLSI